MLGTIFSEINNDSFSHAVFLIKEVKGIEHGKGAKMSSYQLTLAICE
jgi:chorismate synthase